MNKIIVAGVVVFFTSTIVIARTKATERAMYDGADACLVMRVLDANGGAVTGANVKVSYELFDSPKNFSIGLTDDCGTFTSSKKCMGTVRWNVWKDGYYASFGRDILWKQRGGDSVSDGKWIPWGRCITVSMKPKRERVKAKYRKVAYNIPKGLGVFFDCSANDLVCPYGKGKYHDFMIRYDSSFDYAKFDGTAGSFGEQQCTNALCLSVGALGGFIRLKKDTSSELWSLAAAPTNGYCGLSVTVVRPSHEAIEVCNSLRQDYVLFKSRVVTNELGNVVSVNYGILYDLSFIDSSEKKDCGDISFKYFMNPTPNDTCLELQ